jgi:hypothetical protein
LSVAYVKPELTGTIFLIYSSDVLAPLIDWRPGPEGCSEQGRQVCLKWAITFLTKVLNGVFCRQYFPPAWKYTGVVSIPKPGMELTLPSSYRPISLLDTLGKLLEKIVLTSVHREVNERSLLRDEQFGSQLGRSTTLQPSRLLEAVIGNFDESRLTDAAFLVVAVSWATLNRPPLVTSLKALQERNILETPQSIPELFAAHDAVS